MVLHLSKFCKLISNNTDVIQKRAFSRTYIFYMYIQTIYAPSQRLCKNQTLLTYTYIRLQMRETHAHTQLAIDLHRIRIGLYEYLLYIPYDIIAYLYMCILFLCRSTNGVYVTVLLIKSFLFFAVKINIEQQQNGFFSEMRQPGISNALSAALPF